MDHVDWLFVAAEGVDEVRSRIMPVNRKYPLKVLLEACDYYVAKKGRMTFEYILIAGVNDTDEQACELAKIARRLSAKINLIPYNTVEGLGMVTPLARASGRISIDPAEARCGRNLAPRERPRHRRRLRSVTTTDQACRRQSAAFSLNPSASLLPS